MGLFLWGFNQGQGLFVEDKICLTKVMAMYFWRFLLWSPHSFLLIDGGSTKIIISFWYIASTCFSSLPGLLDWGAMFVCSSLQRKTYHGGCKQGFCQVASELTPCRAHAWCSHTSWEQEDSDSWWCLSPKLKIGGSGFHLLLSFPN